MHVRLIIEDTTTGLRATIREKDDAGARSTTFRVGSVEEARRRASSVARGHGLGTYRLVDRSKRA